MRQAINKWVLSLGILLVFGSFTVAHADPDVALALGFRSDNADAGQNNTTVKGKTNFQGGAYAAFPMGEAFSFRTGMIYSVKSSTVDDGAGATLDNSFSYLDVPVTAMIKMADYGGIYLGPLLSLNVSKSSSRSGTPGATSGLLGALDSTGSAKDVASMNTGLVFGFQFKFYPQLGGNVYFETFPGSLSAGVKNTRTVGLDLLFFFE